MDAAKWKVERRRGDGSAVKELLEGKRDRVEEKKALVFFSRSIGEWSSYKWEKREIQEEKLTGIMEQFPYK